MDFNHDAYSPVRDCVGTVTNSGLFEANDLCRALRISELPDLDKSQPLYLRATTVALRNAECVHLVSVGNLLHNEARIAVIACPYDEEVRAAERGYCYETYNPSRTSCTIHNASHAFQSCGATWVLSVPVFAPGASVPTGVIVFITCAWAKAPSIPEGYIRNLQEVAEGMAEGFQDVMAPILQEVVPNFLPFLLSPPPIPPTDSLLLQACGTNDNASEHNRKPPGGAGGLSSTGGQASGANGRSSLEGSEGPRAEVQGRASTTGTHAAPEGALPQAQGWPDDDTALLKKKRPASSRMDGAPRARMHPLLLHFDDGPLEAAFVAAQGQARRPVDFMFAAFAMLISTGLALSHINRAGGYALIIVTMAAAQLLVILLLPTWYLKTREAFCCLIAVVVSFASLLIWTSYVSSPLASPTALWQTALRQLFAEPVIQATSCFGHKIRFRTAALIRAPAILPIGLYLIQFVLQAGWGLGPCTATCVAAVPLVSAVGATLFMLHKAEAAERAAFLSHAAARPRDARDQVS